MRSIQIKNNNEIKTIKENQSLGEKVNYQININNNKNKLFLPMIKKNICFSDRSPLNNQKNYLEGFKPKEDKKIRNKISSKDINKLNIKFLSLNNKKSEDKIFAILKKIKIIDKYINNQNNLLNDDLFDNDSFNKNNLLLLNKYYKDLKEYKNNKNEIKNNFSETPKKLKTILINGPELSYYTTNSNTNPKNIKNKIYENSYNKYVKTENNKNEEKKHELIIHHIFFEWIKNHINYFNNNHLNKILNKNNELNHSYDLSLNSLKYLNRKIKAKKLEKNKKIRSAFISKNNKIKIKFNLAYNNDIFFKNKIFNNLIDRIKFINEDNIDFNYLNTKSFKNLFNVFKKKENLNKKYINKTISIENNDDNDSDSEEIKIIKKEMLSLKKSKNFLGRFLHKLFQKDKKENIEKYFKDNEYSKVAESKENLINKSFLFKKYLNTKKKEIKEKEKENINYNSNKSVKIEKKLNISNLIDKINFIGFNPGNKPKDNHKIIEYKIRNKNKNSKTLEKNHNTLKESSDFGKKYYNIVLISSPEKITKKKKIIIEPLEIQKPNYNTLDNKESLVNNDYKHIKVNKSTNTNVRIYLKNSNKDINSNIKAYFKNSDQMINLNNSLSANNIKDNPTSLYHYNNLTSTISNNKNNINENNEKEFDYSNSSYYSGIITKKGIKNSSNSNLDKYIKSDIKKNLNSKFIQYHHKNDRDNREISELTNLNGINTHVKGNIKGLINNNIKNKKLFIRNKKIKYKIFKTHNNYDDFNENNKEENNTEEITDSSKDNSKSFDSSNDENSEISNYNNENIDEEVNMPENLTNNFQSSSIKEEKDKGKNYLNIEYNKSRKFGKHFSTKEKLPKVKENIGQINGRRNSYAFIPSFNISKERKSISKSIKIRNNFNDKDEDNLEKNEMIFSSNRDENDKLYENEKYEKNNVINDNDNHNDNDNDDISENNITNNQNNYQSKKTKKDLELEKILSNKSPRMKSKTNKKRKITSSKDYNEEDEESELEFIKIVKKRKKSLKHRKSITNLLNINEEDLKKNTELNIGHNSGLNEEDMKKLIIYSTKLRKLAEIDDKIKTEEMIQMEKEIKEKYNEIINKYLVKQQYKGLLKKKGKIKKRPLKILYEEKNEEEAEIEMQLNIKEKKQKESNDIGTKIEDNEEKEKDIEEEVENNVKKKEKKKLIYDNSYLFNKNKKENNIAIKKEVLDILQNKNKSNNLKI